MRTLTAVLSWALLLAPVAVCQEEHHHALTEQEVGSVHFSTSCQAGLADGFNHAVALLHSFQYEEARRAFTEIAGKDPHCAMAWWGIAMSHYHGMWGNGDTAAGRVALNHAKQIGASNAATTAREDGYIDALSEIYRDDGDSLYAHEQGFEKKMGALQAAYPQDDEAAIFHALSLAITAPKTDKTFANQRKCGEILEPIFARQPHHPGIAHYIIHCYDNPVLAEKGLGAARMYAAIAPASAHANHMPSHLFTRVGSWDESIASNLKSEQLAAAAEATSMNGEARDQRLHAMDYLEYAYLQSGRVTQAKEVLADMNSLPDLPGLTLTGGYARAAIPARYAIELKNWKQASGLQPRQDSVPWAEAITWTAIGIGSARTNQIPQAEKAEARLAALRETAKLKDNYWSNQIEVQRREVAAWIAEREGPPADALQLARSAAELEESMDKAAVTPGSVTPAREMVAEMLLIQQRPKESLAEYEAVLRAAPKRFNSLFGAASAAEAAGDMTAAAKYYKMLTEAAVGDERTELKTARLKLQAQTASK